MGVQNEQKITRLLQEWPTGTVMITAWAEDLGVSRQLLRKYLQSGWVGRVGRGAYQRKNEDVNWQGGLYAIQAQAELPIHVGGITALGMQGLAHYVRLGENNVFLFSPLKTQLPAWFKNKDWNTSILHIKTSILPESIGLLEYTERTFSIQIAAPERAILECLYLTPDRLDIMECYDLLEGLVNLRPRIVQELLQFCSSVQVKRLFLYMAQKAGHQWLSFLDVSAVDLGRGDRVIVPGGKYVAEHHITIPSELADR